MPNHHFMLWTSGCAVIVQDEDKPGLRAKRSGWGVKIEQDAGTDNWFNFAIPTGTMLGNETVDLHHAELLVNINNDARISQITIRQANHNGSELMFDTGEVNLSAIDGNTPRARQLLEVVPNKRITGALVLSVHGHFDHPGGKIYFRAAGALQVGTLRVPSLEEGGVFGRLGILPPHLR